MAVVLYEPLEDARVAVLIRDTGGDRYELRPIGRPETVIESRGCTADESARLSLAENDQSIRSKVQQALAVNTAYLALALPTNAQNVAQVRALTRECNALIRLVLGLLTDTTDT